MRSWDRWLVVRLLCCGRQQFSSWFTSSSAISVLSRVGQRAGGSRLSPRLVTSVCEFTLIQLIGNT